ncbi:hypothetical protein RSOL_027640 [Rhizoctonia solani AG-3 Rhs1AP]|uniref:Uncharacterized protein n=2 Tax=Rhizoctonia solani AG-3 TaxID=1086053 RepID=A0A074SAU5_9AGAM|nr:hypothetical protein RSOL_027640 [Rhizoctonia solani AG-3 Rhs1AP]KEP54018.1 hypothetical protein V565_023300 [Rhizoctonia solani 123E]
MPCSSRQERHRARQEHERLEAQRRKFERMEAHERRMRKQTEDAARARVDRARRHHERIEEEALRRREKDPRYTSSSSSQSSSSGYEYFYGAHYQSWFQPTPPAPRSPIHEAISRYKTGLERMNQLVAAGVQLSFADIPWPTIYPICGTSGISKGCVEHIALSELLHPEKDRRGRLFAFLLQWHPDKFIARWMPHVRESDRAAVNEGVTIVASLVNDLLSQSK